MTSRRIFRPVTGPNPARKNSAKNAPVLCQIRHAPGHSLFSFCVKKGLQNGPYSQLHFCTQNASLASPIPAYRLHIADISPTRSSPTAILIYPDPLYPLPATCLLPCCYPCRTERVCFPLRIRATRRGLDSGPDSGQSDFPQTLQGLPKPSPAPHAGENSGVSCFCHRSTSGLSSVGCGYILAEQRPDVRETQAAL